MKQSLKMTFITLCLFLSAVSHAQERTDETIYLKNGSVIRGQILETTGDQLKVETSDGSIFYIGTYDVEKVVRSRQGANSQSPAVNRQRPQRAESTAISSPPPLRRRTLNERDSRYEVYEDNGDYFYEDFSTRHSLYKGFVELGYSFGTGSDDEYNYERLADLDDGQSFDWTFGRFEISTSHGLVFDPTYNYVPVAFLGVGVGTQIYFDEEGMMYLIPVFAHTRIHFIDSRVTPFLDFKLGYSWGTVINDELENRLLVADNNVSISGLYVSPAVGVRFATGSKSGINLSLGYTLQKISKVSLFLEDEKLTQNLKINLPAVSLKLGFDF
jgi:hypothetical protein